jgi:DNA-directed RNA polymerase subunit RPC12/RpoP
MGKKDPEQEALMDEADILYKKLTEEEQKFFQEDNVLRDVQTRIFRFINNYIRQRDTLLQKYKMIQETIERLRGNQCPDCGAGFGVLHKKIMKPYKCHNGHEFLHHEIPMVYVWRIMDIIDEKVENL